MVSQVKRKRLLSCTLFRVVERLLTTKMIRTIFISDILLFYRWPVSIPLWHINGCASHIAEKVRMQKPFRRKLSRGDEDSEVNDKEFFFQSGLTGVERGKYYC